MLHKTKVAVKITRKNRQKAIDLLSEYGQAYIVDSAEGFLVITRKPYQEKASVWEVFQEVPWGLEIINLTKLREILKAEADHYMTPEDYKNKTWYVESTTGNMFLLEKDESKHVGFRYGEYMDTIEWFQNFKCNNLHVRGFWIEASDEEVRKAFDKEAKRRGLVPGVTIKRPWCKGWNEEPVILSGAEGFIRSRARRLYYMLGDHVVFKNRTWAKVVEAKEAKEAKEEVEGKWYVAHRDDAHRDDQISLLFFCTHVKDNLLQGFGFDEEMWLDEEHGWCNTRDIGGSITKATPQEVVSALTNEAIKRGHKYENFEYNPVENALYGYNGRLEEVFVNGEWNEPFDKFAELKEAHKNGAVIQYENRLTGNWHDLYEPSWNPDFEYRIKPEEGEDPYLWGNKIVSEPRDGAAENVFDKISGSIADLLKYKNEKYGSSALDPLDIFSGKAKVGQRLDDKLARIKNSKELKKNDVADLIGYLTLVCVENDWTDFSEFKD